MEDKYLTISTLTTYLKRKFDVDPYLQKVYLVGEISNFRLRKNAHQYFSLKDDKAKISAIMFRSAFDKIKFLPEEGMKVLVRGRIGLYPGNGSYQIYIDDMQPDGVGALYQAYEQLKEKLAKEGLFSTAKKPLPKFPKRIAVVTSPSGAVIRDIITTVRRRYPIVQIVLFPAQVQGDKAGDNIAAQIKMVNNVGNFDTLIIGRGGGSIEDLWPFNTEVVARAIFDSKIPVISSVGHETDTTIADLVADVRAATPTAAAELATPVLVDVITEIQKNQIQLISIMKKIIEVKKAQLTHLQSSYILQDPKRLYEGYIQQVDNLNEKIVNDFQKKLILTRNNLNVTANKLLSNSPQTMVKQKNIEVNQLNELMAKNIKNVYSQKMHDFQRLTQNLDNLSPLKVMNRGFTFARKGDRIITSVSELNVEDQIQLNFSDGKVITTINKIEKGKIK